MNISDDLRSLLTKMFCSCSLVVRVQDPTVLCMQAQHEVVCAVIVMSIAVVHPIPSSPVLVVSLLGYCCALSRCVGELCRALPCFVPVYFELI